MNLSAALLMLTMVQACALAAPPDSSQRSRDVRFTLDNYYNNEWKSAPDGHRWRFHYLWSDTLDSGFSQLGTIITKSGGVIDTLSSAPTDTALARTKVYIIVDPDTPKENPSPAYISDSAARVISRWVYEGGVLLLFGNDSGNAEFHHLNRLASHFGIRFNETSRNKVVGKDYAAGTFSELPDHPMFYGVRKIYLKEISTLSVQKPARALLRAGGDVIIATAEYGKGLVFAVGDPWFYNEYMDHRRLPEDYDNAKAAQNLVRWILRIKKP